MSSSFTTSNFYGKPPVKEQKGTLKADDPVAQAQNTEADNAAPPAEPTEVVTVAPATPIVTPDVKPDPNWSSCSDTSKPAWPGKKA